jgi:GDP-4-dehydro-6-deoxy-D-mannose reductase
MKRVLITGASGFVGSHLIDHLLSLGEYDIFGTYRSDKQQREGDHLHFLKADLGQKDAVVSLLDESQPDYIFNLAAQAHVAESFQDPEATLTNNIISELQILEAIKNFTKKDIRLLVVSTSEVYGMIRPEDLPVSENTPHMPASPYAVSKITQDYLALQYVIAHKLDIIRARPFNHIGPRQSDKYVVGKFARQIAEIEREKRDPILKVGNLAAKRDFTDVRDIVKAYVLLMQKGKTGEVYNIGSGKSHKISDVLSLLQSLSPAKISIEQDSELMRPSDLPDIYADIRKIGNEVGWHPTISLEETLKDTLEYWRQVV